MNRKTLLLLGGSGYLLPVIDAAHDLGCRVVTMDYLPGNVAHRYSDEYMNVSIVEKEEVLSAAKAVHADGIMSFACDPGVASAAYVAEKMGLPFQGSYEAVSILQDKGLFRRFLIDNGFKSPHAKRYRDPKAPAADAEYYRWPVMVKPADSAGSKGVSKVDTLAGLEDAARIALKFSHDGAFIVEDFLTFRGFHSSTDPFTVGGELKFITYSDQLFDKDADNPYTPALIIWPPTMEQSHQDELTSEIQRLMHLLGMGTGIYNIETCVGSDGTPYIMEVSPRGGGCRIAELQRMAYGVDLIEAEVRASIGLPVGGIGQSECDGCWCEMVVHAEPGRTGVLKQVTIDPDILEKNVRQVAITAKPGDFVEPFTGANMALGDIFLRFENRGELDDAVANAGEWLHIELQ